MAHQARPITLMLLSMLIIYCSAHPTTSSLATPGNEPTGKLLSKRRVKNLDTNSGSTSNDAPVSRQMARAAPF
ncbi:hypothetical protein PCASD_02573 [Puccinia coronata f. sp. avenae]|uniref:Secreted protein n=1 Tax=Puccinia coronata f. sp. avenae TaxID=200324 RepID=A0A2N5VBJ1_9BASI|nr:hypothetical protein PCASD_08742 [Puccinia coronata f. sp. avenae]PLW47363.1 hypothetical protein PCASD_02573 [Puccinia coronata f. sp. avenae]